jgi:hypothetical protein
MNSIIGINWNELEIVDASVIGGDYKMYSFHDRETRKRLFDKRNFDFANDTEAIEWLKREHPDQYRKGVEMRVYDSGYSEAR